MDAAKLAELQERAAQAAPQVQQFPPMVPGLTVHIDGDMICYSFAGNDETEPGRARMNAISGIERFRRLSGAEHVVVHLTAPGCHKGGRYHIATVKPYQGQRTSGRKPKNHEYLQDFLSGYKGPDFRVKVWLTREADDGIALMAYHAAGSAGPGYIAIATADKDMRMLPGLHVDWKTGKLVKVNLGDFEVYGEPDEDGKRKLYGTKWFWMQMLHGDTADNIPGLPGYNTQNSKGAWIKKPMGPKTAEKFLERATSNAAAFAEVYGLYCEWYGKFHPPHDHMKEGEFTGWDYSEADKHFCEQAALLWMRTDKDATVNNFCTHKGHGCISEAFPDELKVAAAVLAKRVGDAIAAN